MNVRKVKQRDGRTIVMAEEVDEDGEPIRKLEVSSKDTPSEAFLVALAGLAKPALDLIEAPPHWRETATVSGLSVNYEADGRRGAVVTLLVPIKATNAPLVVNTPHTRQWLTHDDQGEAWMPEDLVEAVDLALEQGRRFLDGERAQGDLFPKAA